MFIRTLKATFFFILSEGSPCKEDLKARSAGSLTFMFPHFFYSLDALFLAMALIVCVIRAFTGEPLQAFLLNKLFYVYNSFGSSFKFLKCCYSLTALFFKCV